MARDQVWLTIGQTAKRTGVAASTLRFYESTELIQSIRTTGNQRMYSRQTLRRLAIIRVAQSLGLTLDEIKHALATLPDHRTPTKKDWEKMSRSWRTQLDQRIEQLTQLRDNLTGCIGCGCLSLRACPLYNRGRQGSRQRNRTTISAR